MDSEINQCYQAADVGGALRRWALSPPPLEAAVEGTEPPARRTCAEPGCPNRLNKHNATGYCGAHSGKVYLARQRAKYAARRAMRLPLDPLPAPAEPPVLAVAVVAPPVITIPVIRGSSAPRRYCAEPGCGAVLHLHNTLGYCQAHGLAERAARQQVSSAQARRRGQSTCACGATLARGNTSGRCRTCASAELSRQQAAQVAAVEARAAVPALDGRTCPACRQGAVVVGGLCQSCFSAVCRGELVSELAARLHALPARAPVARPCRNAPRCTRKALTETDGLCLRCYDCAQRGVAFAA